MTLFINEVMLRLHHLIRTKSTGTPKTLAQKLNCSESSVFSKIKKMKDSGLPVYYCESRQCYCYDGDVEVNVEIILNGEEMKKIVGGGNTAQIFFQKFFMTPENMEWRSRTLPLFPFEEDTKNRNKPF